MKPRTPVTILVDTSFFLTIARQRRNFHEELRNAVTGPVSILTTSGVVLELQRLSRSGGSETARLATMVLGLLEQKGIRVLEEMSGISQVDTALVALALEEKTPVAIATVDRRLRELLKRHALGTIYPRGRKGLVVTRQGSQCHLNKGLRKNSEA